MSPTDTLQFVRRTREVRSVCNILPTQRVSELFKICEQQARELHALHQSPARRLWRWVCRTK